MAPRVVAQFCAYLLTAPEPAAVARYYEQFERSGPPLSAETLPLYQATYLVVALAGDSAQAGDIQTKIMKFTASDARVLRGLVELLKPNKPDPRLARILPLVALPTEVMFAILERQSPVAAKK